MIELLNDAFALPTPRWSSEQRKWVGREEELKLLDRIIPLSQIEEWRAKGIGVRRFCIAGSNVVKIRFHIVNGTHHFVDAIYEKGDESSSITVRLNHEEMRKPPMSVGELSSLIEKLALGKQSP